MNHKFTCLDVAKAAGLQPGRPSGHEILFCCPCHDDRHPSLSINPEKDRWICGPCGKAGGPWKLVAHVAGIDPNNRSDMFGWLNEHELSANDNSRGRRIARTYDYTDEEGRLLFQNVRYEPKTFRQRRPDGNGGWVWNLDVTRLVPYRLPELLRAVDVFIVEGEKDADNLRTLGFTATTSRKWPEELAQYFNEKQNVAVMPDNDETGRQRALAAAQCVTGKVASLKIVPLPNLSEGGDISDWIEQRRAAGMDAESINEELSSIIERAPEWNPPTETKTEGAAAFVVPAHWQRLDLADLHTWDCKPLRPIVEGMIAGDNLVELVASSQTGKTLQAIYIARKILHEGKLFDRYLITPVQRAGYFVLEDPARRIQSRMIDTEHEFPPIERGRLIFHVAPGFKLNDDPMMQWLESLIVSDHLDVLFLDTYQKATPGLNSYDDEEQSKILHTLSNLTRKLNIAIIVLDHIRKSDSRGKRTELSLDDVKGSGAKVQNADTIILMERTADKTQIKFQCYPKDWDQPIRILLNVAPKDSPDPKFTYAGDLQKLGTTSTERGLANQQKIYDSAKPGEWITVPLLAIAAGMSKTATQNHVKALVAEGQFEDNGLKGRWKAYRPIATSECGDTKNKVAI